MHKPTILFVTTQASLYHAVPAQLRRQGYAVHTASDPSQVVRAWHTRPGDLVLLGAPPRAEAAVALAAQLRRQWRTVPLLLLTTHSTEALAIAALRAGVTDYVRFPAEEAGLLARVQHCLAEAAPPAPPPTGSRAAAAAGPGPLLLGASAPMQAIHTAIRQVAPTDSTVLLTGETGTGKELVAALIHQHSPRQPHPLLYLNCAALPDSLVESELFGYARGAFTGAQKAYAGRLQQADGGTLVLDEIGDMSPYAQAKILRALDTKEIQPLGETRRVPVNVRVLAATNQDLEQRGAAGQFRADLFFRLHVAHLHLPPLRDRQTDLPLLCQHVLRELNRRFARNIEGLTDEAWDAFLRYPWPGNVRELKHLLEATVIILPPATRTIPLTALPAAFRRQVQEATARPADERERVLAALGATQWNRSHAAKRLHWSRMTLYRKMAKYHLRIPPAPRVPAGQAHEGLAASTVTPGGAM
jgi:DNA-binding NtrC family response regulator